MGILNMVYGSGGGGGYKSLAELKAMTLSDAITELNTDSLGYYDNLNGNGHIIGIGIANDDNTSYQCWGVSPIVYLDGTWRDGEIIIAKIKTDSNGNLMIPKAGYSTGGSQRAGYNWWVSYDGGSETQYSDTGSAGSITIATGLTADTEHTVVIRPNAESYGWARAFGFYNSGVQTLLSEIVYDGSYMGYGANSTSSGDYFRQSQYRGCSGLTVPTQETLPSSITAVGNYFRTYQYYQCSSVVVATNEVLPNTVITIGDNFRASQYRDCTSLTTATQEILPSSVTSVGNYFRYYQYSGCTSLVVAPNEVLPSSVTTLGNFFRDSQYLGCTSLVSAPREVLQSTVTSIGTYFRRCQYQGCTALTEIQGWVDLSIGGSSYRYQQYYGCNSMKIVKIFSDVGYAAAGSALSNNYVTIALVPSAYLQNYIDTTVYPRSSITNSKFVGY